MGPKEHHIIREREIYGLMFNETLNFCRGNIDQSPVVGDLGNDRFMYNPASAPVTISPRVRDAARRRLSLFRNHSLDFGAHWLIGIARRLFAPV